MRERGGEDAGVIIFKDIAETKATQFLEAGGEDRYVDKERDAHYGQRSSKRENSDKREGK